MKEEPHKSHGIIIEAPEESGPKPFTRLDQSFLGAWWWTVDHITLTCVLILMSLGLGMVYSASPSVARTIMAPEFHFFAKHVMILIPSVIFLIAVSMLSPRYVWRTASIMLIGSLALMAIVLLTGTEIKGARRWISLMGFTLQPSEFLKPALIVVTAWLISLQQNAGLAEKSLIKHGKSYLNGYTISLGLYCVSIALLLSQPDLGISVIVTCVIAAQVFLAGMRFRYVTILFALGTAALGLLYLTFEHVNDRINDFLFPETGDNYQVESALAAIKNGGLFGVGPGQGVEKVSIPDAHSDFIFSVMVEETGLVFSTVIVGLFALIVLRGFKRLKQTDDLFTVLATGGLLTMVALQSVIHIGSAINIIPTKGMTLPFISYGGSSMLSVSIAMGMVLALTRQRSKKSISRATLTMRYMPDTDERKTSLSHKG